MSYLVPEARKTNTACGGCGPITRHAAMHLLEVDDTDVELCASILRAAVLRGSSIYTFGNGGSASTASHLACDLWHRRPGLDGLRARAQCLYDPTITTALANDVGFDEIFVAPLRTLLDEHDVVVGITVSGLSPNVLRALEFGKQRGAATVALLGGEGGAALSLADAAVRVPCADPGVVESVHLAVVHELAVRVYQPAACGA